mgnify:CR=1 FL=1|jgi:hypothetical protein
MSERMGANGMPTTKKIVTWDEHQSESNGTLQEILSVNPNANVEDFEVEETTKVSTSKRNKLK